MANMRIKAQLLLMMLSYNLTTAENITKNKNPIRTNTPSGKIDTFRFTKIRDNVHGIIGIIALENVQNKFNHTTESVSDSSTALENKTKATNFQNNTFRRGSKLTSHNDSNAINKIIPSVPTASRLVEFHEKSSQSARKSKILPFTSGFHDVSNSHLEINGGIGNFMDLDLNKLSIENLQRLNTVTKLSDYASLFGLDVFIDELEMNDKNTFNGTSTTDDKSSNLGRTDRILQPYNSENDIVSGEFASCQPELQTVVLNEALGSMYFPGCVRLRRCGGCCMGNLLECRPTKTEPVKIKVLKVDEKSSETSLSQSQSRNNRGRGRGRALRSRGRPQSRNRAKLHIVHEWQHTSCACQCRMQAHHCHPVLQDYSPNECACVCKNRSEEKLCYSQSSSHFWDKSSCSCKCKRIRECSTGEIFNTHSCRCSIPLKDINT